MAKHQTLCERVACIEGKLTDGLESRVRMIERMQWWQIGIMVTLVGVFVGGLWILTQRIMDKNDELLKRLEAYTEVVK